MKHKTLYRKVCILIACLCIGISFLFASSPKEETYYVRNTLNCEIKINGTYVVSHQDKHWNQDILGNQVWISSILKDKEDDILGAGKEWYYVSFYPAGNVEEFMETRNGLLAQPIVSKMHDIFVRFEVYDEYGTLLFNLDTLDKVQIEQKREDRFVFIVGDYLYQ